jgi:hypothetical protein
MVWRLTAAFGAKTSRVAYAAAVAATVLLLTALHALEGTAWAFAYLALGALPDARKAMLSSLNAMTT